MLIDFASPWIPSPFFDGPAAPKPENSTLVSDRFIALHMIDVSTMPLAPTSAPVMISRLLEITKPAAHAARPE